MFVFLQETEERKARLAAYKTNKSKSEAIKIIIFFLLILDFLRTRD